MSGGEWKAMFSNFNLWGIAIAYMCGSFGWSFFVSWMPKYMLDVQHPGEKIAGWMNTGPLLFGGVACVIGGWLSDITIRRTGNARWGRAIFPIIGFGTAAIAMAGIAFAKTPAQAFVLMCIGSIGNDIGQGAEWASVISIGGMFTPAPRSDSSTWLPTSVEIPCSPRSARRFSITPAGICSFSSTARSILLPRSSGPV